LEAGLERDPTRWEYAALLAEMHRIGSDVARAEELDAFAQRIVFETSAAWYLRSFATFDREKAHCFAQEAVARPDADALAWERYANLCILTDQWEEALRGADVLIEASGDADRWMLVRARLLARAGQVSQALAQYNAVVRLNDDGYLYRGHLYRQLGDYAQAVADYTSVIESVRQPTSNRAGWRAGSRAKPELWAYYHRATALWMQGDFAAAIADYRHIRPTLGRPFYSDARLYVVLREVGSDAEAQDVISRALDEVPDDNAWLRDIFRCLARHITPDALIDEPAARTHTGRRCEAYYYAGEVYRLDGDWDRARACFEQCVATGAAYDPARPLEPMNEYELARWRLKQLSAEPSAPTSARVDD
jgi:tetratricopeptide (TPR) repeat protein